MPYRFRFGFGPRYIRVLVLVFLMGVGALIVVWVGSAVRRERRRHRRRSSGSACFVLIGIRRPRRCSTSAPNVAGPAPAVSLIEVALRRARWAAWRSRHCSSCCRLGAPRPLRHHVLGRVRRVRHRGGHLHGAVPLSPTRSSSGYEIGVVACVAALAPGCRHPVALPGRRACLRPADPDGRAHAVAAQRA